VPGTLIYRFEAPPVFYNVENFTTRVCALAIHNDVLTGVAAALSLGAAGVQPGTAYLLCPEATTSSVHRAALTSDAVRHTALTNLFSGPPARGIMNRLMRDLGPLNSVAPEFPLATAALAPLPAKAEQQGRGDFSPLWAGQNASACRAISAAELTRELGAESRSAANAAT
jgi:nitronate monooxygenase